MPSPLGHALAGAAIALTAQSVRSDPRNTAGNAGLLIACTGLAIAPDLDGNGQQDLVVANYGSASVSVLIR